MNYLGVFGVVIAFTVLAGCSDPKIDASSDEAMKASVEKVRESLPEAKRKDFDESMQLLAFSQIEMKDLFAEGAAHRTRSRVPPLSSHASTGADAVGCIRVNPVNTPSDRANRAEGVLWRSDRS